ncbi:MAG: exodeoxyribonuclease VII small subunit [Gammaproteobacteria bacterium]|jgi:exodeoxyribonuclease VII small subunit
MATIKKPKNFEDNYKKLQDIAAKLRNGQFIDVDQLLPMIKEATLAYETCKARLKAVNLALDEHFKDQNQEQK